jgi:hypothetical protein
VEVVALIKLSFYVSSQKEMSDRFLEEGTNITFYVKLINNVTLVQYCPRLMGEKV